MVYVVPLAEMLDNQGITGVPIPAVRTELVPYTQVSEIK